MATKMAMADLRLVDCVGDNTQRVAVLDAPYQMGVRNALIPEPDETEVRVKIKWVGICGSDLEAYRGTRAPEFISTPARLGHEVSGVIDKVGAKIIGLKEGDKVACRYVWGAYAEYIVCKPFNVKVLPPDFPMLEISPIEVLPGIIHAAELGKIDQSKNVLIMGQGVSGLIMTQVISQFSPKNLAVTDLSPRKLELAKKIRRDAHLSAAGQGCAHDGLRRAGFPGRVRRCNPLPAGRGRRGGCDRLRGAVRPDCALRVHRRLPQAHRLLQGPPQTAGILSHGTTPGYRYAPLFPGRHSNGDGRAGEYV